MCDTLLVRAKNLAFTYSDICSSLISWLQLHHTEEKPLCMLAAAIRQLQTYSDHIESFTGFLMPFNTCCELISQGALTDKTDQL